MTLEKDPQQEDFLQGRMQGNPYRSVLSYVKHKVLCYFVVVVAYQILKSMVDKLSGVSSQGLLSCFHQFLKRELRFWEQVYRKSKNGSISSLITHSNNLEAVSPFSKLKIWNEK